MTKDEARTLVLAEWQAWTKQNSIVNAKGRQALLFFTYLEREKPHLLSFKSSDEKWQVVHGWLLNAHLVSN